MQTKSFFRGRHIQIITVFRLFLVSIDMIIQHQIHGVTLKRWYTLGNTVHHLSNRIALHHLCFHGKNLFLEFLSIHFIHDLHLQVLS